MTEEAAQTNTGAATEGNEAATQDATQGNTLLTGGEEQQGQSSTEATTEGDAASKDEGNTAEYGEFTLPEGLKAEDVGDAISLAKELGLDQEKAQKLVDYEAKLQADAKQSEADQKKAADEARTKMRNDWYQATMKDPEIGGDKFKEAKPLIMKAQKAFADKGLNEFLETTGLGNHPMLVKLFYRVGKAISEDTFHAGANEGAGKAKSTAEKLYPTMKATG